MSVLLEIVGPPIGSKKSWLTLDLETEKIFGSFKWGSGEKNGRRWRPYACGIGHQSDNRLEIWVKSSFDESELMDWIAETLLVCGSNVRDVVFQNSRNRFDEMVCAGRFINARRPPTRLPGSWPILEIDPPMVWKKTPRTDRIEIPRNEVDGIGGSADLVRRGDLDPLRHCGRDVLENLWNLEDCPSLPPEWVDFWKSPFSAS
ncbi:hypothetical protein EVB97_110 [Rhizobium phage RHph_Y65]|uniref:Uncharacterized protein n=1 Tax=Rhizobium phage RHph_Y65 TaxID=2509785 RepID=A0A7S5UYT3_9CAUD|nr:hypothetical protein PQC17_gp110 [Rhizobium phage RHph_Y65]QIG72668.1 hypothetical protein EVB97_110 [Rhizobium phage RHph_Y65]